MMLLFTISVQLSVEILICPRGMQLTVRLSNYRCTFNNRAYPTSIGFNRSILLSVCTMQ